MIQEKNMDALCNKPDNEAANDETLSPAPSRVEAEAAVRTLIKWAGDNPDREGLAETPKRVVKAYEDYFKGYNIDAGELLSKTFEEVEGYDDMVVVRDIEVTSHCEHHMVPVIGRAHVAYLPNGRVVGLSKLARVVDTFARRLQTQETMTVQIADAIEDALSPRGVAIMIDAEHQCMTIRGVENRDSSTITTQFRGAFTSDEKLVSRFFKVIKIHSD
jgi:GTP cyclohydrolase IA